MHLRATEILEAKSLYSPLKGSLKRPPAPILLLSTFYLPHKGKRHTVLIK